MAVKKNSISMGLKVSVRKDACTTKFSSPSVKSCSFEFRDPVTLTDEAQTGLELHEIEVKLLQLLIAELVKTATFEVIGYLLTDFVRAKSGESEGTGKDAFGPEVEFAECKGDLAGLSWI